MAALTRTRPPQSRTMSRKQDSVTILMTAPGYTASKRFMRTDAGIEKVDFNAGMWFGVLQPLIVSDIVSLSEVLSAVEHFPNLLVIRGAPAGPGYVGAWVRRKGSGDEGNFFTPPAGRYWVLIDFDKIEIPSHLSLKKDPVAVCEYLVELLPREFHNVTYHWQMSSSAGMGDPSKVSMHVWYWLARPVCDAELKVWAKSVNAAVGFKLVDTALFQDVQAHYTAAPIFEGMPNPFPKRSGLNLKQRHAVDLVLPVAAPRSTTARTACNRVDSGNAHGGSGFEYHLSRIGDHPGGDGFHAAIVAAAASYVGTHGNDGTDVELLFGLIKAAVMAADATHHDAKYIEHMASREHIVPAIESALNKFGAASPRRKARIVDGVTPHFASIHMSVDQATKAMADFARKKS